MNARARILMSFEDYLDWESRQEEKFEYVDGEPVLRRALRGMAGGTTAHDVIAGDLRSAIKSRLPRRGRCIALGSDFKVRSPTGNSRYPDVSVDCSGIGWKALFTTAPKVVFEVMSPSNDDADKNSRLADYRAIRTVAHIGFVEQDRLAVELWTRDGDDWRRTLIEGEDGVLDLAALEIAVPLAEIYETVLSRPD